MQTDDPSVLTAPLAELLPVAAGLIDADGVVLWANAQCRTLFGWDPAQRPRVHTSEILDDDLVGIAVETQRQMGGGSITERHLQGRFRRLDGTVFEAECRVKTITIGPDERTAIIGTIVPTGESQIDNPFRRALDLQRELICEWSPGGTILFTNKAYREWFGYEQSIVGRNLDDYVDWDPGDDRAATIARFKAGEHTIFHTRTYDDGRSVEWANTLVRNDDGSVISVLGVGRDITDRATQQRG
jgi:PAS domain S-box-containing protein